MSVSILKRIKDFFSGIFNSKKLLKEGNIEEIKMKEKETNNKVMTDERKTIFDRANEQEKLLSLQKMYLQGKIKEKELTKEQITELHKLFDSQIENMKRNNLNLQRKILKSLTNNQEIMNVYEKVKTGEVSENQLTKDQIKQINFLLNIEIEKTKMEIKKLQYRSVQA